MEGLGHRMLSTAYVVDKPGVPLLHKYKTDELVSRTSGLMHVSEKFYKDIKKNNNKQEEEQEQGQPQGTPEDDFLPLCRSYLRSPDSYTNDLTLNLTEEEKKVREKKRKEKQKEKEEDERWNHKTEKEKDPSTMEFLKRRMAFHGTQFALHRACWERVWGSYDGRRGAFDDTTTLSSMRFTDCTPDACPFPANALGGSTLQIYYIKVIKLKGNLKWPLQVHGLVAARDTLDRNRNILFSRSRRHNYQLLTQNDPFLHLTGPSRAILAMDPVDFEVKLEIEGAESRDRASIKLHKSYHAKGSTSLFFHSPNCILELSAGRLATRLQATVVGVCAVEGFWPFKRGCRVVCSSSPAAAAVEDTPREVVLFDYLGDDMPVGSDGYLHLSRNVVSVELQGTLRVVIQAYSRYGRRSQEGHVDFPAQQCQTSKGECFVANCKLEIVVAWSLLMNEKPNLLVDCPAC